MAAPGNAYTVDTNVTYPPPPPRPPKTVPFLRQTGGSQTLLYALVALALCGMAVEACFIYRLYNKGNPPSAADKPQISHQVADKPPISNAEDVRPSKPMAHLTGSRKPAANGHMFWNDEGESELRGMKYEGGNLTIQMEGYYFVYSKIYFAEKPSASGLHSVVRVTDRYPKEMVLLQSREYHPKVFKENHSRTNSYLGGMFHLFAGDVIFVKVHNTDVVLSTSAENYFGAYMV